MNRSSVYSEISMVYSMMKNRNLPGIISNISDHYRRLIHEKYTRLSRLTIIPIIILEEAHLLVEEKAVAYPTRSGNWKVLKLFPPGRGRQIPVLSRTVQNTRHGSQEHTALLREIYTFTKFVEIEPDDVVVDVGSFIGTLSFCFAEDVEAIIAIDPIAAENNTLAYNMRNYSNVFVVPKAAWDSKKELVINKSALPNENSVFTPDQQQTDETFSVAADTVPNIVLELGFDRIDFLKIEAEGAEPEILNGALDSDMDIKKVAVDASAERDGNDIIEQVGQIFESHNYEWRVNEDAPAWGNKIVFAKQQDI